jgi:predicted flap endonuclease-1-like 5' DNA nuclease
MSILTVALITSAIAFVAGWLVSKAYFRSTTSATVSREKHHELLKSQRTRYRKRMRAFRNVVKKHEEMRDQIRQRLVNVQAALDNQSEAENIAGTVLDAEKENSAAIQNELALLKIERDELTARITRLEAEAREKPRIQPGESASRIAELRTELGALRETLASREHKLGQIETLLGNHQKSEMDALARLSEWKKRVQPLTQKLHYQQAIIRQLKADEPSATNPSPQPEPPTTETYAADNLQAIRGIGPALEKRLRSHGINHFRQIAEMNDQQLTQIAIELSIAPTLPVTNQWIEQARSLGRQQTA